MSPLAEQIKQLLKDTPVGNAKEILQEVYNYLHEAGSKLEQFFKAANVSPQQVWEVFVKKDGENLHSWADIDLIGEGLGRVEFSLENYERESKNSYGHWGSLIGPRMFGSVPGVGCFGGGDWEYPLFFVVFLDANGQTLRSYVPKEGNTWNYDTASAFGNGEIDSQGENNEDVKFLLSWLQQNRPDLKIGINNVDPQVHPELLFDEEKIIQDIVKHIHVS